MNRVGEIVKLGDVCSKGSSNISKNKLDKEEGVYPIYGASGFIKNVSFYHNDKPYISIIKDGAGVGRVKKMDAYTSVIGTLQYIYPKEGIDLDYLYYSLLVIDFNKYSQGAAIPHVYFKDYKEEPFLLVSLSEQRRIVSILDKAFDAIEKAKANAEENLKNSKELFESYLNNVFENKGEDWEEKRLEELFDIQSSKRVHKADWKTEGVPFYRAREVVKLAKNGFVDNELFISEDLFKQFTKDKGAPKKEDIIISAVGTLGQCYLVRENDKFYIKDASVLWFSKISDVDSEFVEVSFKSKQIRDQVFNKSMGATVGTLTISRAKNITINLPPISEQKRIVQELANFSKQTKNLEKIYQEKLEYLEEMKKSLLHKAFNGEV